MADQLSAELEDRFSAGPPDAGAIVRVRDLIVCAGDPSLKVPIEEVYAHPPIGWDRHPGVDDERFGETVDTIDLGRGITIEDLDRDTVALVMNACTPRGHYFLPVRQFGQRYSFVKEVSLDELDERHYAWDTDGTLDDALTLSRLVRDNGYSTEQPRWGVAVRVRAVVHPEPPRVARPCSARPPDYGEWLECTRPVFAFVLRRLAICGLVAPLPVGDTDLVIHDLADDPASRNWTPEPTLVACPSVIPIRKTWPGGTSTGIGRSQRGQGRMNSSRWLTPLRTTRGHSPRLTFT